MSEKLNEAELRAWLDRPCPPKPAPEEPEPTELCRWCLGTGGQPRFGHDNADRCDVCEGFGRVLVLAVDEQLEAGHA